MITAPKIHTNLLWDLSCLFIGLGGIYFLAIFFYRNRLSARSKRVKQRKKELSPMISEFIFYEDDSSKSEKSNYLHLKIEIRELIKDNFSRSILSEILLDLQKDVSGDAQKQLFRLYQDLGLHNDAFKKLKSWRWEIVSKAILDLTQMQVDEAYSFIIKFINDKRTTIRKQAEIATVTLKNEGLDYFLDTTKYKISEWQQLKLLDVVRNQKNYQPPRFKAWLTSTNTYVVLFALRLIKFYNQNDANASLIELTKHKNTQIKEEAIACIKEFNVTEAIPILKLVFWKSSTDIKIAILNTIGVLGTEKEIEFLRLIEKKEPNFSVKSKALSSINNIVPESIMPSKGILDTSGYQIPDDLLEIEAGETSITLEEIENSHSDLREDDVSKSVIEIDTEETLIEKVAETTDTILEEENSIANSVTENVIIATEPIETVSVNLDFLPPAIAKNRIDDTYNPNKTNAFDSIDDVWVIYEDVSLIVSRNGVDTKSKEEVFSQQLAFLPIIIENEKGVVEIKNEEMTQDSTLINQLEVEFETVTSETVQTAMENNAIAPHERASVEISPLKLDQYNTAEIRAIKTIYEVLLVLPIEDKSISAIEVVDPYFLSSLKENMMDEKSNVNPKNPSVSEKMNPQDEQKFEKIFNDLIDFENKKDTNEIVEEPELSPLLEFENELIDISFIPLVNAEEGDLKEEEKEDTTVSEQDENKEVHITEPESTSETVIPKSVLTDEPIEEWIIVDINSEELTMQLLDDLTEMGDYREVQLLNEMLINEKYSSVKERIKKLIDRFSEEDTLSTNISKTKGDVSLTPFNVFEDLFRSCDTEAKLILLNEVVAVGDEGELSFLEALLHDTEELIAQKAAQVLEELKIKLNAANSISSKSSTSKPPSNIDIEKQQENHSADTPIEYISLMEELEIEPSPSHPSGIFDIEFELTENEPEPELNAHSTKSSPSSLIGQFYSISHKIIKKLNG